MSDLASLSLLDFIVALSPHFQAPYHLREWCAMIESCLLGGVRGLCAIPIRHHKTWTTLHGVAWMLVRDPTMRIIILCADHERALELGKMCRRLCDAAGVGPARGDNTIVDWKNERGGGVCTMSAEQSRLGRDCDVLLFDDPIGTPEDADEIRIRDAVDFTIAHYTARAGRPGRRGSVLGVMSPWHPDDPLGRRRLRTAEQWTYVGHPAIEDIGNENERAFAPGIMPLEEIKKRREELAEVDPTERLFWAQFMCSPRVVGGAKFHDNPERWQTLPPWSFRLAYGVDLAFTAGEGSDHFALVVGKVIATKLYILDVQRHKLDAHLIESTCRSALNKYGHAPFYSYVSGPEVGTVKIMRERGLPFVPMKARYNKLVRAERTIKRWNEGQIAIPQSAPWLTGFLHRVELFRGLDKGHDDDEIDALVSLADGVLGSAVAGGPKVLGKAYSGL